MGLVERIKALAKANLSHLLEQAEDPEEALRQLIATMEAELAEARLEVASAARDEHRLCDQHHYHLRQADVMAGKARLAVQQGEDDLAREALRRRRSSGHLAADLKAQWSVQQQTVEALRNHLLALEAKIDEACRRREILLTRRRMARVRQDLQEAATHAAAAGADRGFERLEECVDELETHADASAELAAESLDASFERLTQEAMRGDREIEGELQRLKQELGSKE